MKVFSSDFENRHRIPKEFTADGKNVHPQISWSDVPKDAKSLALIVEDPDAPKGTFTHWMVGNIRPDRKGIERGSVPQEAIQAKNDFGKKDYGGPAPPRGTHRFFFRLYALDTDKLDATDKNGFYRAVKDHKIDEASIMGTYSRE